MQTCNPFCLPSPKLLFLCLHRYCRFLDRLLLVIERTSCATLAEGTGLAGRGNLLWLSQRPVALNFPIAHQDKHGHHKNPVEIIRQHGTIGGRISPPEDGIKEAPAATSVCFYAAALRRRSQHPIFREGNKYSTHINVPYTLANVIRAWPVAKLIALTVNGDIPSGCFKVPYGTREETGANEIEKTCRQDEKDLQLGRGAAP
jgi:hypothetical protein